MCNRSLCWIGCIVAAFAVYHGRGCLSAGVGGSGVIASETRQVQPFSALHLEGVADIDATISDHTEVIVTADDNLLPMVETTVSGDALVIRETQNVSPKTRVHVTIKTPNLSSVSVSGVGNVNVDDLKESNFTVNLSGTGTVAAKGQTDTLQVAVSGAGQANLADLAAQNATLSLSGAGNAKINSTATLDINLSGVGHVSYKGSPKLTQHVSGVGSVTRM
jgi:hypothetical protein